ncbi:MAG: aminopeptidase P family protein [Clostridia bacterium]|nr:aminopeptidase P family protein [Clostridia bacterium]
MNKRIEALRGKLKELGIDGAFLTSAVSHRYFTKFNNGDGSLLITAKNAYAFEDFRYIEMAEKLLKGSYTVIRPSGKREKWLGEILQSEGIKRLGFEDLSTSVFAYGQLKADVEAELVPIGKTVVSMRQVKDEWEIEQIRQAQAITDKAFSHILGILSLDMTENDVASELEYFMRKNGAEDKSFETISISGAKTSLPHGEPENVKLQRGFLTMDFGATVNGYHADMTRTVCLGKADEEMKKLYNTVLQAQLSALEFLQAGVSSVKADSVARDIINKEYNGYFGHSLGHSVGLEIHESPVLSVSQDTVLLPGHVVTVEPGIYIPGKYGVRIEDLVVIRDGGITNLTVSPKELIEI